MGRDRGKFNKRGGRGGRGNRFQATSADEIELRNARLAEFDAVRAKRRAEADEDDDGNEVESGDEELKDGMKGMNLGGGPDNSNSNEPRPMTRKEREEKERERKAAEYRRRHELGLTDEYKRDMAKLAEVRKRREESQQKAAAEKEAAEEAEKERKALAVASGTINDFDSEKKKKSKSSKKKGKDSIPKLDKISIKKMKPPQLKEALKTRGLDIQGNAKALTERLLKHEAER